MNEIEKTPEYFAWIGELKKRYRSTQIKASVSVNSALLEFYWFLGKDIGERYPASKLGNQSYKILSADLKMDIPNASGLSPSSLKYSGYFYRLYSKLWIGQQVADLHIEPSQQPADSDNLPKSVKPTPHHRGNRGRTCQYGEGAWKMNYPKRKILACPPKRIARRRVAGMGTSPAVLTNAVRALALMGL